MRFLATVAFMLTTLPLQAQTQSLEQVQKIIALQEAKIAELSQKLENQTVPLGSITAWHPGLDNSLKLPTGWVLCDGKPIPSGPLAGKLTPNLNGEGRFLRGATSSGSVQDDQLQGHGHNVSGGTHAHALPSPAWGIPSNYNDPNSNTYDNFAHRAWPAHPVINSTAVDGAHGHTFAEVTTVPTYGPVRAGTETRPKNMSVVWIMRVQ